jgi:hypothetical protein
MTHLTARRANRELKRHEVRRVRVGYLVTLSAHRIPPVLSNLVISKRAADFPLTYGV